MIDDLRKSSFGRVVKCRSQTTAGWLRKVMGNGKGMHVEFSLNWVRKEEGLWSEKKGHRHVYILKITECTFQNGGKDAGKRERLKTKQRKWVEINERARSGIQCTIWKTSGLKGRKRRRECRAMQVKIILLIGGWKAHEFWTQHLFLVKIITIFKNNWVPAKK